MSVTRTLLTGAAVLGLLLAFAVGALLYKGEMDAAVHHQQAEKTERDESDFL